VKGPLYLGCPLNNSGVYGSLDPRCSTDHKFKSVKIITDKEIKLRSQKDENHEPMYTVDIIFSNWAWWTVYVLPYDQYDNLCFLKGKSKGWFWWLYALKQCWANHGSAHGPKMDRDAKAIAQKGVVKVVHAPTYTKNDPRNKTQRSYDTGKRLVW